MKKLLMIVLVVFSLFSFTTLDITKASWYGYPYHGRKTASGEVFNKDSLTAAHRTLPFGTKLHVTNLANGKEVTVRINDRGPYAGSRDLDLSEAAFKHIANLKRGVIKVEYEIVK